MSRTVATSLSLCLCLLYVLCCALQEAPFLSRQTLYPSILTSLKARQKVQQAGGVERELQQMKCDPELQAYRKLMARDLTQLTDEGLHALAREVALQQWAADYKSYEEARYELEEEWWSGECVPDCVRRHVLGRLKEQQERERARNDKVWDRFFKREKAGACSRQVTSAR